MNLLTSFKTLIANIPEVQLLHLWPSSSQGAIWQVGARNGVENNNNNNNNNNSNNNNSNNNNNNNLISLSKFNPPLIGSF